MASEQIITYQPRNREGTQQNLLPSRYSLPIQIFSMLAFTLAFVGWKMNPG